MYEALSTERKELQSVGHLPDWVTTGGWQLFKERYLYDAVAMDDTFERIAHTLAAYTPHPSYWEVVFYEMLWNGWLMPATPVLSNTGTPKGMPVSCSGQYIHDSISGFYDGYKETALLTKYGFGTSGYLGDIRPRGAAISIGGTASGVMPVIEHFVQDMRDVAQGTSRRGAWAGYLPIDHGDFWEVLSYLRDKPDDANIGWCVSDDFIARLNNGEEEAIKRYQGALKVKAITGKGYFFFPDKANRARPEWVTEPILASNLCTEIMLPATEDMTFTCVLSSLNLSKYREWEYTDTPFNAIVFLDAVASYFMDMATDVPGLDKAVRFTEQYRALGLGTLGFHSLLQQEMIPFESLEAHMLNNTIFAGIRQQAEEATRYLAVELGEPEKMEGTGRRNSHLMAIAPNMSTALLAGGVSQGIEPIVANVYNQLTAAGEIYRVNPTFLRLTEERVGWSEDIKKSVIDHNGSVQHLDYLTDHEKLVLKTAYELDQSALVRLASARQRYIDQGQSLNLFFSADEDEEYISQIHKQAFLDENIKSLYYMRTMAGVQASKGECIACEG